MLPRGSRVECRGTDITDAPATPRSSPNARDAQRRTGPSATEQEWQPYVVEEFAFDDFGARATVLDVGCGAGEQLDRLQGRGARGIGVDADASHARGCRGRGRVVVRALAEALPFCAQSFDGVICKVVLPYTRERAVVHEMARVLRAGGRARCAYIGAGYYLRYLVRSRSWRLQVYGLRTLLNTWLFAVTGRQAAGRFGDTVYQSRRRLTRYYAETGLTCLEDRSAPRFLGFPVFIYHTLVRGARPEPLC